MGGAGVADQLDNVLGVLSLLMWLGAFCIGSWLIQWHFGNRVRRPRRAARHDRGAARHAKPGRTGDLSPLVTLVSGLHDKGIAQLTLGRSALFKLSQTVGGRR